MFHVTSGTHLAPTVFAVIFEYADMFITQRFVFVSDMPVGTTGVWHHLLAPLFRALRRSYYCFKFSIVQDFAVTYSH